MVIYVLLIVVGVCALGAALVAFSRTPRRDDVERFHRARQMTTEWSRTYAKAHVGAPRQSTEDLEPEPAEPR